MDLEFTKGLPSIRRGALVLDAALFACTARCRSASRPSRHSAIHVMTTCAPTKARIVRIAVPMSMSAALLPRPVRRPVDVVGPAGVGVGRTRWADARVVTVGDHALRPRDTEAEVGVGLCPRPP